MGAVYCGFCEFLWLIICFVLFAPVCLSSEVKEAVMAEPEKVPESSEEVRAQRSAGLTQLYHSPDILHIKRQTTFNKGLPPSPLIQCKLIIITGITKPLYVFQIWSSQANLAALCFVCPLCGHRWCCVNLCWSCHRQKQQGALCHFGWCLKPPWLLCYKGAHASSIALIGTCIQLLLLQHPFHCLQVPWLYLISLESATHLSKMATFPEWRWLGAPVDWTDNERLCNVGLTYRWVSVWLKMAARVEKRLSETI